jgi:mono/diheme cytochrome c family protein
MRICIAILVSLCILVGLCSCSSAAPGNTTSPATTTSTANGTTFGSLADSGKNVFAAKCSSCHGTNGEGGRAPAVIGSGASLGKYQSASQLLSKISTTMPANSPGSLSHQDYLNVLSYLLVQNNYVSNNTEFNESQLGGIPLK